MSNKYADERFDCGEKGWHSGESTRLPPMWPGLDSRTRGHRWVQCVVGSGLCSERFFSGYSGFPSPQKPMLLKSNSIWKVSPISCEGDYTLR